MYSSDVAGVAPCANQRSATAAKASPQTGATTWNPIGSV